MIFSPQDLRYTLRQWRRSPGFAVTAIITLALGIGANTAIFLLTYSIVLKSLPVPHPEQLIRFTFRKGDSDIGLSYLQYQEIAKRQNVATGLFAYRQDTAAVRQGTQTETVPFAIASGSIFKVLQIQPALGRAFEEQAGEPGVPFVPEALLGYDYWRTAFHGDPSVLGRTIDVDDIPVIVIGVLPQGFEGVQVDRSIDVLLPLSFETVLHPEHPMLKSSGAFWLTVMGRLRTGTSVKSAAANLSAIAQQVNDAADPSRIFLHDGFFSGYTLGVESGHGGRSFLRFKYSKPLLVLGALSGMMLLLCSVNVALLVLSRVSTRVQEFAIRNALGATRGRLLAQVVTETVLLGLVSLAVGMWLAWYLAESLASMIAIPGMPPSLRLQMGLEIFAFASGTGVFAALLAGLWPAWRTSRVAPAADLKRFAASRHTSRIGLWLVPAQVTLGVLLLHTALLLSGTLLVYLHEHSGFAADNVVLAEPGGPGRGMSNDAYRVRVLEMLEQVQAMPGVETAAIMNLPPISNGFSVGNYYSHDRNGAVRVNRQIWPAVVSANYFATMGTRILAGRSFTAPDIPGDKVCVVSASAAQFFFQGEPAVGQTLINGDGTEKAETRERCRVIGVAEDARLLSILQPPPVAIYLSLEQRPPESFAYVTLGIRAANPTLATDAIRRVSARVFPGSPPPRSWLFQDAINADLSRQRLLGMVSGTFALLGLALLGTGLYGILMRLIAEQRRDIGIRIALGARRDRIVKMLARGVGLRIAIGLLAGTAIAAVVARYLRPLLFGVSFASTTVVLATLAVLFSVLIAAFVFPAIMAVRIDPAQAIREE